MIGAMEEEEVELITVFATCRTDGCGNSGIPIPMQVPAIDVMMMCGVCSNEITDVTETPPPPPETEPLPEEIPEWLA